MDKRIDYTYASEEDILREVKRVRVRYNDGSEMFFDPHDWIVYRLGIIKNLLLRGLCEIQFKTKNG
jgi:NAD(P)H-nitrite reductase large subunit